MIMIFTNLICARGGEMVTEDPSSGTQTMISRYTDRRRTGLTEPAIVNKEEE